MTTMSNNQIRKEITKGELLVARVYKSDFQKEGTLTAEIKQTNTITSFYPSKSVTNSLSDNPFSTKDFNFKETEFKNSETRVTWIDVPQDADIKSVQEQLSLYPNACLKKTTSNHPILSQQDEYAINQGIISLDNFADKQILRYPNSHQKAGEIILDNYGKPQFRRITMSLEPSNDADFRNSDPSDYYSSPKISTELNALRNLEKTKSFVNISEDLPI